MNQLIRFGAFIGLITLGFIAGDINSSLLGIDLSSASSEVVSLVKICFWALGLGVLFEMKGVFQ